LYIYFHRDSYSQALMELPRMGSPKYAWISAFAVESWYEEFPDAVIRSNCLVIKQEGLCLVVHWYLCDMSVGFARVPRLLTLMLNVSTLFSEALDWFWDDDNLFSLDTKKVSWRCLYQWLFHGGGGDD
jgi:hypothetical protein